MWLHSLTFQKHLIPSLKLGWKKFSRLPYALIDAAAVLAAAATLATLYDVIIPV